MLEVYLTHSSMRNTKPKYTLSKARPPCSTLLLLRFRWVIFLRLNSTLPKGEVPFSRVPDLVSYRKLINMT